MVESLVPELQMKHEGAYKGCGQGKNLKNPFLSSDYKVKEILEIVHSDVCKSISSKSLRGYGYYVSFIYYYSCKTWIYFMKTKVEVFSKFKEFKSLVENHIENKRN